MVKTPKAVYEEKIRSRNSCTGLVSSFPCFTASPAEAGAFRFTRGYQQQINEAKQASGRIKLNNFQIIKSRIFK